MYLWHNWALWQECDINYLEHVKNDSICSMEHLNWSSLWQKLSPIQSTSVAKTDRVSSWANSGYKLPSEHNNGFSKRILEESLASITPHFRQASMKRAARSKCLMLQRRWKQKQKDRGRRRWWELFSGESLIPALMSVILKHTSTLSFRCLPNFLWRLICCQKQFRTQAVKDGDR